MTPFSIAVPDSDIADLHARLDRARWPGGFEDPDWSFGMNADVLRELVQHWRHGFDWRAAEARINRFDQYLAEIEGLDIHFIHQRSPHPEATPLLMTHGWPGSIVEFLEVIPRLTNPEDFGGTAADAFHVVCPSLAGFAYSPAPQTAGMHPGEIARRHDRLMALLGYDSYLAQGGDWGSVVTQMTAVHGEGRCRAIHLNLLGLAPPAKVDPMAGVQEHEKAWLEQSARYHSEGSGYLALQSTRPAPAGFALADSPLGLCAWIAEKFYYWSDCEAGGSRDIRNAVSWDDLLTNISLYWFSNSIASSLRVYREFAVGLATRSLKLPSSLPVPFGASIYPAEIIKAPRAWAERFGTLIHWSEPARGGHFAAMEQPELFAQDLRQFARAVKAQ